MSKNNNLWMPLYVADYLADTMRLSTEQHGAYMLLIMDYWRNGPPPDDELVLCSITRLSVLQWRKHAPALAEFFDVADGVWNHARIDSERAKSLDINCKRTKSAKDGAAKRWGKTMPNAMPNGINSASQQHCQNDAQSQSQLQLRIVNKNKVGVNPPLTPPDEAEIEGDCPTLVLSHTQAGEVCKAMKSAGLQAVNPSNQTLATLIESGASVLEFQSAAADAVKRGKGFAYALQIVVNERKRAAELAWQVLQGPMPSKGDALRNRNNTAMTQWLAETTEEPHHATV
jgi:uncharacterized protein YdaU (DUF1376 family)